MSQPNAPPRDPVIACALIALAFLALVLVRIGLPPAPYFDEVHYVPAARALLEGVGWLNREHPPLGKELIALGIALIGDSPTGWRTMPALAGSLTLFAAMRALWFASQARFATLTYGTLLASGGFLYVQARIAMLDVFMALFLALALWQLAAAMRQPETGRWRMALAGVMLGLSLASKWNVAPLLALPGLAFLVARLTAGRRRLLLSERGIPVPGVSLAEAAVWLGLIPLLVYWATFLPVAAIGGQSLDPASFLALHREIIALQQSVTEAHPYQSSWPQWVLNIRPIWYLYELVAGAQRGILLLGNPLTMLAGLPALAWCLWTGLARRRWDALGVAIFYAVSLGMWLVAPKPVQFYYHYFLPNLFLLAALALLLDGFWQRGTRWLALGLPAASLALFAWFYPILSGAPLADEYAFEQWMWLDSWR
ncbi:phospholipid carrier-dependent glycosyltransferase [Altererythrobacter sp. H2]|uniref:phospholipid carrier-dependent glycosyltransferase n=1 Tax=Altererythrobacter sp. H2 TaxID=3108391 RepID=UPI002B4BB09F|nr:phospholipid carrier-dependent glycosyltransferase [Altererythrobacter sp. H2]WRK96882.1 phospholipid carrier-dependent glycosyltransferase [Altererythrobacter sp. H2]